MPLYLHALERFSPFFEVAVIVLPGGWEEKVESQVQSLSYRDKLILQLGGHQCRLITSVKVISAGLFESPF